MRVNVINVRLNASYFARATGHLYYVYTFKFATLLICNYAGHIIRPTGIEPVLSDWKSDSLPLTYGRWDCGMSHPQITISFLFILFLFRNIISDALLKD